jgi:hypothetical protein
MLAAYRETKNGVTDTTELDVHLERCASCRKFLAQATFIGARVRALPEIEPPPDMHAQLMRRLAREHLQFMQKAPPGSVTTPEFLKPFLREHAHSTLASHPISALSTAETGPLPIIRAKRPARTRRAGMSQFAILGLAAMFLVLLMTGGVTSLVYLAQRNAQQLASVSSNNGDLIHHVDISEVKYTTKTLYPHIVSAVGDSNAIYYTAYSDAVTPQWMLLQMNRAQQTSTPLLAYPTQEPIIVLGSSPDWLVWLQYGTPQMKPYRNNPGNAGQTIITPWSLYSLSLAQLQSSLQSDSAFPTPVLLLKGDFNAATAPSWVHTPVQGTWFMHDTFLVAVLDATGHSRLLSYQLELAGKPVLTTIATAAPGHIFTSPTADSSGANIYWADEWISSAGYLSSNIWLQGEVNAPRAARPTHGRWSGYAPQITQQQLFLSNGMSYRPQIADDMLFWISAARQSTTSQGTAVSGSPPVESTPQTSASLIPRIDAAYFAPPLDASVSGLVMMQPVDGDLLTPPAALTSTGLAYALQVGADFALWQSDKGYEMFDAPTQGNVTVGSDLNNAAFLAVNGSTATWIEGAPNAPVSTDGSLPAIHIFAFNWPK